MSKGKSSQAKLGDEAQSARKEFAQAIAIIRSKLGYQSAYAFFHRIGGKRVLLVSYLQYRLIERGLRLPSVATFEALLNALTHEVTFKPQRTELMLLYLRALVDANPVFNDLWSQIQPGVTQVSGTGQLVEALRGMWNVEARLADEGAKQLVKGVPRMPVEHVKVVQRSAAHYWVWQWLIQTGRDQTPEFLSEHLQLKPADVQTAIRDLTEIKLIVEGSSPGTYRSPDFERNLFEPSQQISFEQEMWLSDVFSARAKATKTAHHAIHQVVTAASEDIVELMALNLYSLNRRLLLLRPQNPPKKGKMMVIHSRIIPAFDVPEEATAIKKKKAA